MTIHGTHR
jgi:predicted ester cyclase